MSVDRNAPRRDAIMASMRRVHYAWVVVGITFVALLVAAGVRAAPGALVKPLEADFGWDRASISLAAAVSLITYGLGGPLGGSLVGRFGVRRVMVGGLALIALGVTPMLLMTQLWQLHLLWGVVAGVGTGAVAQVLGATIAATWFRRSRGVVLGLFGAATSAGQLIFLPVLVALTVWFDWRAAVLLMALAVIALVVPAAILLRDRPQQVGLRPYGETGDESAETLAAHAAEDARGTPLRVAVRQRDFQLLAASFFVCGYTSTGLVGVHFIPHAVEHGFAEITAAGALGVMGMMNVVGTLTSGWLTDRYDNRRLLAAYYGFRALSLLFLPWIIDVPPLLVFAVVFGLDYIATVPPTANLTAQIFGRASVGTLFGWIFFAHMVGAALAAYLGGVARDALGDYTLAFISAAVVGFVAVALSLGIRRQQAQVPAASPSTV
jgi:sugar phosphate permease